MCLTLLQCIGVHSKMVFHNADPEDTCDKIRNQWHMYQLVEIPEEWLLTEPVESRTEDDDLELPRNNGTALRVDRYWAKVFKLNDSLGQQQFRQLEGLIKCILSLSHGNARPEQGFSQNHGFLTTHGNSIDGNSLIALRRIKDTLSRTDGGYLGLEISKELRNSVMRSRKT